MAFLPRLFKFQAEIPKTSYLEARFHSDFWTRHCSDSLGVFNQVSLRHWDYTSFLRRDQYYLYFGFELSGGSGCLQVSPLFFT
jgi:hypothetical protein